MTEGAPAPLATWEEVQGRWRTLTAAEQAKATLRLAEASSLLRLLVPGIEDRAATNPDLAVVMKGRVVDVVIRFLQNPTGAKQLQETIGPRAYGLTYDGQPTGIFFLEEDLAPLRPSAGTNTAEPAFGTAFVGVREGWGPVHHRRHGWPYPC